MDYDVFIVPEFKLDTNYNYDIRLVVKKELTDEKLNLLFKDLSIEEDTYFSSLTKKLYYCNVSCLVDIKKWLTTLTTKLTLIGIEHNVNITLLNKIKN